jgi:IS30 family transposase
MTGDEFQALIEGSEYSQRQLAERWGVSHTTIQRECAREKVRGLYRDAIRQVTRLSGKQV